MFKRRNIFLVLWLALFALSPQRAPGTEGVGPSGGVDSCAGTLADLGEGAQKAQERAALESRTTRLTALIASSFGAGAQVRARRSDLGGESIILDIENVEGGPFVAKVPKKSHPRVRLAYKQEEKIIAVARTKDPEGANHLIQTQRQLDFKVDGVHYPVMVMPRANKGSLFENLADYGPKAEPKKILKAWKQMLLAIRSVHRAGFVHRDIKPMNFLIDDRSGDEHFILTDFGIALAHRGPLSIRLSGTKGYMSVNQARSGRPVSQDDMESIGIVFKEMLMGMDTHNAASSSRQIELQIAEGKRPASDSTGLEVRWEDLQFVGRYPVLVKFPKAVYEQVHPWLLDIAETNFRTVDEALQAVDQAQRILELYRPN